MTVNFVKGPTLVNDLKQAVEVIRTGQFATVEADALAVDGKVTKSGTYTMVAGDDTAGLKDITTGLATIDTFIVQILTAAGVVTAADVVLTKTDGTIRIADGSVYKLTAGHLAKWIAIGTV